MPPGRGWAILGPMILWRRKSNLWLLVHRPAAFARVYRRPLAIMLVGGALDAATTLAVLRRWGVSAELHPAMWLMGLVFGAEAGVPLAMVAKMAFAIFAAATFRRWCAWILVLFGLLSALGACYNPYQPF